MDIFRPRWRHSSEAVRIAAVEGLDKRSVLQTVLETDGSRAVRSAARRALAKSIPITDYDSRLDILAQCLSDKPELGGPLPQDLETARLIADALPESQADEVVRLATERKIGVYTARLFDRQSFLLKFANDDSHWVRMDVRRGLLTAEPPPDRDLLLDILRGCLRPEGEINFHHRFLLEAEREMATAERATRALSGFTADRAVRQELIAALDFDCIIGTQSRDKDMAEGLHRQVASMLAPHVDETSVRDAFVRFLNRSEDEAVLDVAIETLARLVAVQTVRDAFLAALGTHRLRKKMAQRILTALVPLTNDAHVRDELVRWIFLDQCFRYYFSAPGGNATLLASLFTFVGDKDVPLFIKQLAIERLRHGSPEWWRYHVVHEDDRARLSAALPTLLDTLASARP